MISLILSADDFGYHAGIDDAVLELAAQGHLSATSCMTLSPRWREAASAITAAHPLIDVGLHLDFTEFGDPHSWPGLLAATHLGRLDLQWVRRRIAQQLDAFEDALNAPPDYIDGHRHVHQLPVIRTELLRQLLERYSGREPWIRISRPPTSSGVKGLVIRGLGSVALAREADRAGFACSQRLLGVYGFDLPHTAYQQAVDDWLAEAEPLDTLMVHVARVSPATDPIRSARTVEYQVLRDDWFAQALLRNGIRLVRGAALREK